MNKLSEDVLQMRATRKQCVAAIKSQFASEDGDDFSVREEGVFFLPNLRPPSMDAPRGVRKVK